jgi:hypothetical protein
MLSVRQVVDVGHRRSVSGGLLQRRQTVLEAAHPLANSALIIIRWQPRHLEHLGRGARISMIATSRPGAAAPASLDRSASVPRAHMQRRPLRLDPGNVFRMVCIYARRYRGFGLVLRGGLGGLSERKRRAFHGSIRNRIRGRHLSGHGLSGELPCCSLKEHCKAQNGEGKGADE